MTQAGIDSKVNDSSLLESFGWRDGAAQRRSQPAYPD